MTGALGVVLVPRKTRSCKESRGRIVYVTDDENCGRLQTQLTVTCLALLTERAVELRCRQVHASSWPSPTSLQLDLSRHMPAAAARPS